MLKSLLKRKRFLTKVFVLRLAAPVSSRFVLEKRLLSQPEIGGACRSRQAGDGADIHSALLVVWEPIPAVLSLVPANFLRDTASSATFPLPNDGP